MSSNINLDFPATDIQIATSSLKGPVEPVDCADKTQACGWEWGTQPLSTARGQEWEVGAPAESVTKGTQGQSESQDRQMG